MRLIRGIVLWIGIIALLGTGVWPEAAAASSSEGATLTVERWRVAEIELKSDAVYDNPFLDVEVTATFIGPSGEVIVRPGFWDGGQTWKVRFAPTAVGQWKYTVTSSDPSNGGLAVSGKVRCVPYAGDLEIYQRGFLKVGDDNRYLAYADGTPFFWLGDTHWFFDRKESWDSANKPGWSSQFKGMVDRRVEQGFTVYQSVIFGPEAQYWEPGQAGVRLNPERFREQLDRKMAYIADSGLVNAFGVGFHSNIDGFVEGSERLAEYVVARYGAYPMVWITGGEGAGYDKSLRESRIDGWRKVAQAIHRNDAYDHPQAAHTPALTEKQLHGLPQFYEGEGWFDFELLQGGHKKFVEAADYHFYRETYGLPLVESEANYEQINDGWATEPRVRQSAYRAIQAGSFGFTYGAHGIWNAAWDANDTRDDSGYGHANWFDAIDYPGGYQMTRLRDYYASIPWHTLRYRPDGWADWSGTFAVESDRPVLSADDAANVVSVYFSPETSSAGALHRLAETSYRARWFNPRSGEYTLIADSFVPVDGNWTVPEKPDSQDWLLLVEKINADPLPTSAAESKTLVTGSGSAATASSSGKKKEASAVLDGDRHTVWKAETVEGPQWIQVDLGRAYELTEIRPDFGRGGPWHYRIEGSRDGSDWFPLIDRTGAAVAGERFAERVSGTARYVKIALTGARGGKAQLAEFEVFAKISSAAAIRSDWYLVDEDRQQIDNVPSDVPLDQFLARAKPALNGTIHIYEADGTTPVTEGGIAMGMKATAVSEDGSRTRTYTLRTVDVNLAREATATASSVENGFYSPAYVIDGINSTETWLGWAANQLPAWVQLDFGGERTFNKIEFYTKAGYEQTEYTIQYWKDGQWVNAFETVTGNTADHRSHLFPEAVSSKLRVYMTRGNVQQDGEGPNEKVARINELEVYSTSERAVESITLEGEGGADAIRTPLGSLQMKADIAPADATYRDVVWKVTAGNGDATKAAVISPEGLLTAKSDGTVKVTAYATDGSGVKGEKLIVLENQPEPVTPLLVSLGKPVAASSVLGGHASPSAITDGDPATSWVADGAAFPQWFTIDLEKTYRLMSVEQLFNNEDQWKYVIEGSRDGEVWFALVDESSNRLSSQHRVHEVSGEARYVRMTFLGAKEVWPNWASSMEFQVFAEPEPVMPDRSPVSMNKPATASSYGEKHEGT